MRIAPPLVAAVAALACACTSDAVDPLDVYDPLGGKFDDATDNVLVDDSPGQHLASEGLQRLVCTTIARSHRWADDGARTRFEDRCASHEYRIVERTVSTLYSHVGGGPLTLTLDVAVVPAAESGDGTTFSCTLDNRFDATVYAFDFEARCRTVVPEGEHDAYITELADSLGEQFDTTEDTPVRAIDSHDLPEAVVGAALREVDSIERTSDYEQGADIEREAFEILRDGDVVGYVVALTYRFRYVPSDGGLWLYYNRDARLVTSVEWW